MKVFLLEDDIYFIDQIKLDLKKHGHEVKTWECVNGAAEEILNGKFDLLIVDIILPYEKSSPGNECMDGGVIILEKLASEGIRLPTVFISKMAYSEYKSRIESLDLITFGYDVLLYFDKDYDENSFFKNLKRIEEEISKRKVRRKEHRIEVKIKNHDPKLSLQTGVVYQLQFEAVVEEIETIDDRPSVSGKDTLSLKEPLQE